MAPSSVKALTQRMLKTMYGEMAEIQIICDPFSPLNPQIFRMVGKKAARKTCSK